MSQALQPVIDAIKRGDKPKAIELIKQILSINPNNVEALLMLAHIVDEPIRKRQVLNRVLSVSPTNTAARERLLEMDRLARGASPTQPVIAPALPENPLPPITSSDTSRRATHYYPDPLRATFESYQLESDKALSELKKRPFVFTGAPLSGRIFNYFYIALVICVRFLAKALNVSNSTSIVIWVFLILGWACFMALKALLSAPKIELRDSGIHTSTLLTHSYMNWNDIASLKSNSANRKLKLISNKGKSINISTQVEDYPVIAEVIRLKRPDLFGGSISPAKENSTPAVEQAPQASAATFPEAKTFRKSFFKLYGFTFGGILYCMLLTWMAAYATTSQDAHWDVISITAFLLVASLGVLMIVGPFFSVSAIKIEANVLTIEKFFGETEVRADEIKKIKMGSNRGRYGSVSNFVGIWLFDGRHYGVTGFTAGEEIIYGFLMNWWVKNQNN